MNVERGQGGFDPMDGRRSEGGFEKVDVGCDKSGSGAANGDGSKCGSETADVDRLRELASLYVRDRLDFDDKAAVFRLILTDELFKRLLKEEVELRKRMEAIRVRHMPAPARKTRLLNEIRIRAEQERRDAVRLRQAESVKSDWLPWSEWTLRLATPPIVFPIIRILQRRFLT